MPTYEYLCQKCGHEMDFFQSMKDAPLTKCPQCGKPALKRLPGLGAGIIFKGTGFYETDYRRPTDKKAAAAEKASGQPATGDKAKTAPAKATDKPAAKPVAKSAATSG